MEETSFNFIPISKAFDDELTYMKGRKSGEIRSLKTPFVKLNRSYMNGFEWRWIVTIAGMSGSGKTALANALETGFFRCNPNENFAVLNFTFEMIARRLIGRKISEKVHTTLKDLYSVDAEISDPLMRKIESLRGGLTQYNITYVETVLTIIEIKKYIKHWIALQKAQGITKYVIFLDHTLLVKNMRGEDERQSLTNLMATFNELKKHDDILFIVLSQLNRNIEDDDRISNPKLHYPKKKDIFGSDSTYQFSDAVLIQHRPEMLGIVKYGPKYLDCENKVYLHCIKARDNKPQICVFENDLAHNTLIETNIDVE